MKSLEDELQDGIAPDEAFAEDGLPGPDPDADCWEGGCGFAPCGTFEPWELLPGVLIDDARSAVSDLTERFPPAEPAGPVKEAASAPSVPAPEGAPAVPSRGLPGLGEALLRAAARREAAQGRTVPEAASLAMETLMRAFTGAEDRGSVCVRADAAARLLRLSEDADADASDERLRLDALEEGLGALSELGLLSELPAFLCAAREERARRGRGAFTPLVLDRMPAFGDSRIYFARFALEELELAQALLALEGGPADADDAADPALLAEVDRVAADSDADALQRRAILLAVTRRLSIISGGPGTGKTTTVAQILECLLARNPMIRIALAAPTGKATSRMEQSIRSSAGRGFVPRLAKTLAEDADRGDEERRVRSRTIHKWLASPGASGARPGPGSPLEADVLIVDEASMVDIHLAARLFAAIGPETRVIILGDKHQLAAVGPGAVFAELSDAEGPLSASVAELRVSRRFRAGTVIARLADAINHQGETTGLSEPEVLARVVAALTERRNAEDGYEARLHADEFPMGPAGDMTEAAMRLERERFSRTGLTRSARAWIERELRSYGEALLAFRAAWLAGAPGAELAALARALWERLAGFRALAAMRRNEMGVNAINRFADGVIRELWPVADGRGAKDSYPGRVIIVRKNDEALDVHNGDVAILLPRFDPKEEAAGVFRAPQAEVSGGAGEDGAAPEGGRSDRQTDSIAYAAWFGESEKLLAAALLPAHDTAWAMTIHQSQGSEFERVAVFLPPRLGSGLATRELLYTAVTRTKRTVDVFGPGAVLAEAVRHPTVRDGSLGARLALPDLV